LALGGGLAFLSHRPRCLRIFLTISGCSITLITRICEALHYYREALNLYLKNYGDAADPEKVAILEKNIALALFYRGQYPEALEYFDRVLSYYGVKTPGHWFFVVSKASFSFIKFLISLYLPFLKFRNIPTDKDKDKRVFESARKALNRSSKSAYRRTEALKLMGTYYWLTDKQGKALKWWTESIVEGERMGARLELSRTYFEVGKRLLEPKSKFKALNDITAEEYLEKARCMFKEMDLQWDLDEWDKVLATYRP
jgi:tetratricopeptide (TPR) repeat protein